MLQRGHSIDRCEFPSTLCKYDLRKGDLFVLSWARVRRVMWGKGVRSILSLILVARYIYIWRLFAFMSIVVTVWRSVSIFVV